MTLFLNHFFTHLLSCICHSGAEAVTGSAFNASLGPIFLDALDCEAKDKSLLDCNRFTPLGLTTCDHSSEAGIRCIGEYAYCGGGRVVIGVMHLH